MAACPTRLLPSTNAWPWTSEKPNAAAFSTSVGYRSTLPKVALGWAVAGSSAPNRGCRRRRWWPRGGGGAVRRPRRVRATASGETPVQLLVLSQHAFGGCLEVISRGCQEVRDRGTSEILRREAESVGFVAEPFCLRWRKIDGELHEDSVPWRRPVQQPASAQTGFRRPLTGRVRQTSRNGKRGPYATGREKPDLVP